ncbi:MAG TPA: hypothetical protein VHP83_25055 [Aggregatilineaceae bacterium]|nr:hypothetical protein [Aggregatilineaceae bacterium]
MQRDDGCLCIAERHGKTLAAYHITQGDTNDCGPHVVAMAVNFWTGQQTIDAHQIAQKMNRPRVKAGLPPIVVRRIPNWATFPWGIVDMLREYGLHARWRLWASKDDLQRALREDHLVAPIFGEPFRRRGRWSHVALLAEWNPSTAKYYFVDSARSYPMSAYTRDELLRYWRNMGRIMVEAY